MRHNRKTLPAVLAALAMASCVRQKAPFAEPPADAPLLREVPSHGGRSPKQGIRELFMMIKFGNDDEKLGAAKKLEETADDSVAVVLLDELGGRNPEAQFFSARALSKLHDASAVPLVLRLAERDHPRRFELVALLGDFRDARAIPLLGKELGNDDPAYRAAAAEGLGKIGSPSAVARLLPLVTEREAPVRNAAVKALGDIGDPAASPALVKALEDKTDYVRAAAIEALGKIGEPAMGLLFDAIAFGNPDYRLECMESLVAMGPKAVPSLAGALEGADAVLKPYIIRALGNIGSKDSIPALVRALDDAEGVVRGDAANALRMLAAGSALPKLRALARDDPNEYARAASEAAVRSISGQ